MSSDNDAVNSNNNRRDENRLRSLTRSNDELANIQQSELDHCWSKYVWFSGYLSRRSYIPPPKVIPLNLVDDTERDELLAQPSYRVPSGQRYYGFDLPQILMPTPTGKYFVSLIIYLVVAAIALVLLVIAACPIPWYKGSIVLIDWFNSTNTEYINAYATLWWIKQGDSAKFRIADMDLCPAAKQYYQAIAASMIIGAFFTLCSIIAAVSRLFGKGGYGWTLMFGLVGLAWTLAGSAMSMKLLHVKQCGSSSISDSVSATDGFIMAIVSWLLLLIGVVTLTVVTQLNIGPSLKQIRLMNGYYLICVLLSLLLVVLANGATMWKRSFSSPEQVDVLVRYWNTEVRVGDSVMRYSRQSYQCDNYNKRMQVSIGFLFGGTVSLFFAAITGIYAYVKTYGKLVTSVWSIIASVLLCCSWINSVILMHRESCSKASPLSLYASYPGVPTGVEGGLTKFPGYTLDTGVALVIVSSILSMIASVLNILF